VLILAAIPASAQRGAGVGAGPHTNPGVGNNTHADVPGAKSGVKSDSDGDAHSKGAHADTPSKTDIASKIEADPKLSAKLQAMLRAGQSLSQAAAGFKNKGQFIAALHVSHNLNIPFDQLKAKMTGSDSMSLGAAIKAMRPNMTDAQAKEEAKKAEH